MRSRFFTTVGCAVAMGFVAVLLLGSSSASADGWLSTKFSQRSFCGRYVSSYTGLYQPSTAAPGSITEGVWALEAAVLTVDGKGNIKDGELTQNALGPAGSPQMCSITGNETYTVGSSPQGEPGYVSMNPQYTCFGSTCNTTTGLCTFSSTAAAPGTIQWACYLSDPSGDVAVCTELGSLGFVPGGVPISAPGRAVTWRRTSSFGCNSH